MLTFLLFIPSVIAGSTCQNGYPPAETADIVRKIIDKGVSKNSTIYGYILENILITRKSLEIDGIEYLLNDNSLPPEWTFYFDILQFSPTPVFVVDGIDSWTVRKTDAIHSLAKISRRCGKKQVLCGLLCCPEAVRSIQKKMTEGSYGNALNMNTLSEKGVIYSLSNGSCSYSVQKHDILYSYSFNGSKITNLYYTCSRGSRCCTLECKKDSSPPISVASVQLFAAIFFLSLFVVQILYKVAKGCSRTQQPPPEHKVVRSNGSDNSEDSQDSSATVTSTAPLLKSK